MDVVTYALSKKYTDTAISSLPKPFVYKGAVSYQNNLPNNAKDGHVYTVVYKGVSPSTEPWGAEFVWGKYQGTSQWVQIGSDSSVQVDGVTIKVNGSGQLYVDGKQDTLVSGTNLKTINGNNLLGSGNVAVKTYQPFPNGSINGSLQEVVTAIMAFPTKAQGMAYLGGISGSCVSGLGLNNAECTVTFMTNNIAVLSLSSSDTYPYHWEYNTASSSYEWRCFVIMPTKPSDFASSTYTLKFVNGVATWVKE